MSLSIQDIFDAALAMPADIRAELADKLLESFDEPIDPKIMKAWAEEAERRMAALRERRMEAIPGDQAMAQIEARWLK